MQKPMIARPFMDLAPFLQGEGPAAVGIDGDGAVYVAKGVTSEPLADKEHGASFPKSQLTEGTRYTVSRWNDGAVQSTSVGPESIVASTVQPTPRGFLLVGARCHWRSDDAEKNAVEYSWEGEELGRFTLGDGIETVRTTPNGSIWASYFDEGIFGNYGWGGPGPAPIGESGFVRFDAAGNEQHAYSAHTAGTDTMCDAYAVNVVDDDEAWVYFYHEFPIVRICHGTYQVWAFGESGGRGLAIDGSRVLLYGGYKQRNLLRLVELGPNGTAKVKAECLPAFDDGELIEDAYAIGVGKKLYLLRPREVLVIDEW